ncbi:hypothetical protein [Kitasatospora sp. GP82]|uniref:ATP-dependent DNA ligase n=1 Tax=Kitasatospora sp. GP82 TaxID=3035089 RepID=UPI00247584C8|nr:hypothetical protein [Kitasatospora sp. GP82]MDH6129791.1 ATP-dependent DNA ligase [Kitasatospora sp. GP82]
MPPFRLPIEVALAKPIEHLPTSAAGSLAEPKADGWRAIVVAGPHPRVYSRHGTDLTRAFADVAEAARHLTPCVLDGELLAVKPDGTASFTLLQTRSGKGPRPGAGFAVHLAAFDALARGDETDLRRLPYLERRAHLLDLLQNGPAAIQPLPATEDLTEARRWFGTLGGAIEGCVLKPTTSRYLADYGSGWRKYRVRTTVDAAIVGIVPGRTPAAQAAVLAQPDARGRLRPVGVSLPLGGALRAELADLLRPAGAMSELSGTVGGLPGSPPVPYLPVHPDVVVEISVDQQKPESGRYRHRPRVLRRRADLTADQLTSAGSPKR